MFSHGRSLLGPLVIIGLLPLIPHGYGMMFFGLAVIGWLVFGLPPIVHRALIRKPLAERLIPKLSKRDSDGEIPESACV
jgi:hypothetical protein